MSHSQVKRAAPPIWVLIFAFILLASGIILPESLAALQSDYNSAGHYLSELGAIDAPYAKITNLLGFLPVAISSAILLIYIAARKLGSLNARIGAVLLMVGVSSGYLTAVFFPCDFGCPIEGSARQAVHNMAGLIQYPLGAIGLIMMGAAMRHSNQRLGWLCQLSGAAMAVGFVMMLVPDQSDLRGAWQRLGDYSAFIAIIAVAIAARTRDTVKPLADPESGT